jgi:aspartyl-tRNA synthetase
VRLITQTCLRTEDSLTCHSGDYIPTEIPHFLWITEFPLFTRADSEKDFLAQGRWSSTHHPFTAPMWEDIEAMYQGHMESVRGQHYDLVLNGIEIGGGSVRVHDPEMQEYIFTRILKVNNFYLFILKSVTPNI